MFLLELYVYSFTENQMNVHNNSVQNSEILKVENPERRNIGTLELTSHFWRPLVHIPIMSLSSVKETQ